MAATMSGASADVIRLNHGDSATTHSLGFGASKDNQLQLVLPEGVYDDPVGYGITLAPYTHLQGRPTTVQEPITAQGYNNITGIHNEFPNLGGHQIGYTAFRLEGQGIDLQNCSGDGNYAIESRGVLNVPQTDDRVTTGGPVIENVVQQNRFSNYMVGIDNESTHTLKIRHNIMDDNSVGAVSNGYLDLGEIYFIERGSKGNAQFGDGFNVFYKNVKNAILEPDTFTNAEGNWWYDKKGNLLTEEGEILETIDALTSGTINLKRSGASIDVIPAQGYDHPEFQPFTSVSDWQQYE